MKRKIVSEPKARLIVDTDTLPILPKRSTDTAPFKLFGAHVPSGEMPMLRRGDSPFINVEEVDYDTFSVKNLPPITDDELMGIKPRSTADILRKAKGPQMVEWSLGVKVPAKQLIEDTKHFVGNALSILMCAEEEEPEYYADIIRDARELLEEFNNKYSESDGD